MTDRAERAWDVLDRLIAVIEERRAGDPAASYVARLLAAGRPKLAQKVGEEAVETALAAVTDDRQALVDETADLVFHLLTLLTHAGIDMDEVLAALAAREGISGLDEKKARSPS